MMLLSSTLAGNPIMDACLPVIAPLEALRLLEWQRHQDPEVEAHSARVARIAVTLGRELGLGDEALADLELGARLHDVGKGLLPRALIHKAGTPRYWERKLLRAHALLGANLLEAAGLSRSLQAVAAAHHEWWDGGGYPARLHGGEIPLAARITAVADAFDAMTVRRCYREAWTPATAGAEIRAGAGRQFCPDVVAAFDVVMDLHQRLA